MARCVNSKIRQPQYKIRRKMNRSKYPAIQTIFKKNIELLKHNNKKKTGNNGQAIRTKRTPPADKPNIIKTKNRFFSLRSKFKKDQLELQQLQIRRGEKEISGLLRFILQHPQLLFIRYSQSLCCLLPYTVVCRRGAGCC